MKKILLFVLLAGFVGSCDNIIDFQEPGRLSPDKTFESVSDLQGGLLGVYRQMDVTAGIYFNSVFTDEISIGLVNGGQGVNNEYVFTLNTGSAISLAEWTSHYDVVNAATRLIKASEDISPGQGQQQSYDNIIGQAYAIRAFENMKLMTYFAEDLADDSSLGIIIVKDIPDPQAQLPRNTTGESYSFIMSDLDQAESLIPAGQTDPTFMNQGAITSMRARIAAYRQNYGAAQTQSQQIIDNRSLASPQEYVSMFRDDTQGEVIFKLERTIGDIYDRQGNTGSPLVPGYVGANYSFTAVDNGNYFEIGRPLFNELDDSDIRKDVIVAPESTVDSSYPNVSPTDFISTDLLYVNKYRGNVPGENQPLLNDLKVFRVSEMLLINAEARAAQGDLVGAALDIKRLTDARYTNNAPPLPVYTSKQEAFADILDQRRKELAFEGHRWIDLGRLGTRAGVGIDRDDLDCTPYGACDVIDTQNHKFRLPIPDVELNANKNIQQNPGYGGGANAGS